MSQPTDRNLLVGILALQLDFITSQQLVMAMNAWILQKQRPLEDILEDQQALSADTLALLQALVRKHLEVHEQDAAECLQSIASAKRIAESLRGVADEDVQASLRTVTSVGDPRQPQSIEYATAIDSVCDQFIEAWRTGPRPQIEDYLSRVPSVARDRLLRELLKEEFFLRQAAGDAIAAADYRDRFPGQMAVVERALEFHLRQTGHQAVPSVAQSPLMITSDSGSLRFQTIRPHAKGGLGEVFVAQDTELNREVALKEIQARYAYDTSSRARFLVEAEITGRLEHPGIVPVYGLGQYSDGRPYYAMRFIQGDSLKEAIAQFHHQWAATGDLTTGEAGVEFRRLLTRFVTVCETLEYAHSRGIVHRDLKPSNIMLGKYGETLVVDWGLAKLVKRAEQHKQGEEPTLTPTSGSDASGTAVGSALGTPVFMSPEQAEGRVDALSPATDIYSLGATLYQLLTGQPPFAGRSTEEILRRVQAGEFPRPSDVAKVTTASTRHGETAGPPRHLAVPKPLEAICLKAMSRKAEDRYHSAAALAADIDCYLADEPVGALAEPTADRLRRWGRKNPTTVGSLAVGLLMATMSLGLVAALVSRSNAVLEEANTRIQGQSQQITQQNVELQRANEAAQMAKVEAQTGRQLAEGAEAKARQAQAQAEQSAALAKASELSALERSAEVAARRGDWEQTLEFIQRAQSLTTDPEQRGRLEIEKAKGEWVLSRTAQARQTLEGLRTQVREGPLRPRILLWSAMIDSSLGIPQAKRWLEEVGSADSAASLEPGERSLVRALLARKSGETIGHLRDLLREEPFFPGAQHLLIVGHLLRGERQLAHREIEIARRLHPGDPNTAIVEALLLAFEKPGAEVATQLPSLLAQMPEPARPVLQRVVTLLSQSVDRLRSPSSSQSSLVMLVQDIRTFAGIIQITNDLNQDSLLLGPSILLGQRWFETSSQSNWLGFANPEGLLSEMLEFDLMGDLTLLRGMLRYKRGAAADAERDLLSAANGGRMLMPLEDVVVATLAVTQVELAKQDNQPLNSVANKVTPRLVPTLSALREVMARRGPPVGPDLPDSIESRVSLCQQLGQTQLGEQFLDLWDASHPPTARTLRLRGDLLRAAAVPDVFRALDCYQRALAATSATDAKRQELEELVRVGMEEIRCRAEAIRWMQTETLGSP